MCCQFTAVNSSTGEVIAQTKCAAEVKNILKFIASIKEKLGEEKEIEFITGYEAGCLRFSLYHELAYHDISCIILAPSTMHGSYKAVHIPIDHDNEIKEYIGLREDVILSRKKIKRKCLSNRQLYVKSQFLHTAFSNKTTIKIYRRV